MSRARVRGAARSPASSPSPSASAPPSRRRPGRDGQLRAGDERRRRSRRGVHVSADRGCDCRRSVRGDTEQHAQRQPSGDFVRWVRQTLARVVRQRRGDARGVLPAVRGVRGERNLGGTSCTRARSETRGDDVVAMLSLESIGYFSDRAGSQHYPGIRALYPDRGDFVAFVGDLGPGRSPGHDRPFRRRRTSRPRGRRCRGDPRRRLERSPVVPHGRLPAIMVTDTATFRNPNYHRSADTPETVD